MSVALVYHPSYSFPFPGRHRFPMEKFRLLHERLRDAGIAAPANLHRPGRARPALLSLAHCPEYLDRFLGNRLGEREAKRMGLPWSEDLARRTCIAPMGTLLAAQLALKHGVACHLAGATHHAHYDFGSGFCILNDLAITARALRVAGLVKRVLIFDCDVHQGDGTAAILTDDADLFTCSIHCEKNFPTRKTRSDLDVGLPVGLEDEGYLAVVEETLSDLLRQLQPDLVLYDAGVDVYAGDPLGRLAVSLTGLAERERRVLTLCRERDVPVATVIGGGYDDDRPSLARRHALVVEAAHQLWRW